jgi:hypothetical protein
MSTTATRSPRFHVILAALLLMLGSAFLPSTGFAAAVTCDSLMAANPGHAVDLTACGISALGIKINGTSLTSPSLSVTVSTNPNPATNIPIGGNVVFIATAAGTTPIT